MGYHILMIEDYERLFHEHVELVNRLGELLEKLSVEENSEDIEKEIVHIVWRLQVLRRRVKKSLKNRNPVGDELILLEYYSIVGLDEEKEYLEKILDYATKGYKYLRSHVDEIAEYIRELRELKSTLESILGY